jgi:hypothetical protein
MSALKSPFVWFGGKRKVAPIPHQEEVFELQCELARAKAENIKLSIRVHDLETELDLRADAALNGYFVRPNRHP